MWRKIISLLACMALIFTSVSAAEFTIEAEVSSGTADIVINCGADMAGKMITVTVFEPESGFEALSGDGGTTYTVTDSQTVNKAISMVYQQRADAEGKVSISYKPKGVKGRYFVRVGGENIYKNQTLSFDFVAATEAQDIVDTLAKNPDADEIAKIFVKSNNENVYTEYQLIGVHNSQFYSDFDAAGETVQEAVYTYISGKMKTGITVEEFNKLFDTAAYTELVNGLTSDKLADFIEKSKEYSGLDEIKIYNDIKNSEKYYTDNVKKVFISAVENAPLTGADTETVKNKIADSMLIALLSGCEAYGTMRDAILDFENEIKAAGGNTEDFKNSDIQLNIARDVMDKRPFSGIGDFAVKLNEVMSEDAEETTGGGTVGSGSGSGKTGSKTSYSGGAVSSTVYTTDATQTTPATAVKKEFTDLGNVQWAKEAIFALKSAGIINGRTDTIFAPGENVTRSEFVKMLVLALDINAENAAETEFTDVTESDWYAAYVKTAVAAGIVTGYGDSFGAADAISRQDMATMTYRALTGKGIELEGVRDNHTFEDEISGYAAEAIEKLYGAELINGRTETEFAAKANTTRAEAAKFLYGIFAKYANG